MKRKDNNSGFSLFWRGAIMQLKITTDYAIRIVYYLACRGEVITASELAYELKIPESYIPKITKIKRSEYNYSLRRNKRWVFTCEKNRRYFSV